MQILNFTHLTRKKLFRFSCEHKNIDTSRKKKRVTTSDTKLWVAKGRGSQVIQALVDVMAPASTLLGGTWDRGISYNLIITVVSGRADAPKRQLPDLLTDKICSQFIIGWPIFFYALEFSHFTQQSASYNSLYHYDLRFYWWWKLQLLSFYQKSWSPIWDFVSFPAIKVQVHVASKAYHSLSLSIDSKGRK